MSDKQDISMPKISNIKNFCRLKKPLNISKKTEQLLDKAGVISPIGQRVAIGTTALILQPAIDLNSKDIKDEKTRKSSATKSAARAIVGTATGLTIRYLCREGMEKVINAKKDSSKYFSQMDSAKIKQFAGVTGTLVALGVMVFTNFIIDAPLTNYLMNFFAEMDDQKSSYKKGGDKWA